MHLSPFTPEETAYVARTMADDGASDEYIGAALMYHYHDLDDDVGVSVQVVRDQNGQRSGVVVREMPFEHYPEMMRPETMSERRFGVPDDANIPETLPVEA